MQWLADLLVALFTESVEFLSEWWPSLVLFAVLVPLLRGRKLRVPAPPPWVMYAAIGALAFGAAVMRTVVVGEPHPPWFNDNFGYLLEADTFLHGRLANPMHPMHRYFDTLYEIQTPSYASEYPPGIVPVTTRLMPVPDETNCVPPWPTKPYLATTSAWGST